MSKIKVSILALVYILTSCFQMSCHLPAQCRAFNDLPREQQHAEFRTYSIEKQLDIYLCLMKTEPPSSEFAYDIADRGEESIPYIITKLEKVSSETEKLDLIYILEVMSDRNYLRGKKDIIDKVKEIICTMKVNIIREQSLEKLKRIQINSGPYSPLMSRCPD